MVEQKHTQTFSPTWTTINGVVSIEANNSEAYPDQWELRVTTEYMGNRQDQRFVIFAEPGTQAAKQLELLKPRAHTASGGVTEGEGRAA